MSKSIENEEDMFRVVLKYFLSTKKYDTEKNLRQKYCQGNKTLITYFGRAWKIYNVLEICIDSKINKDYKNSKNLKANERNMLIDTVYSSIRRFQYEYRKMDSMLDYYDLKRSKYTLKTDDEIKEDFDEDIASDMIETRDKTMHSLNEMKSSISNIFRHFINKNCEYTPNISYKNVPNPYFVENHPTNRYVFKDVLYKILRDDDSLKVEEVQFITDADIQDIIEEYDGEIGYINSSSSRSHILKTTLDFLKALDIIKKDSTNPYEVIPFIEKEWKLDALTKVDTIEKILTNLDKVKKLTPKQKKYAKKVFQCIF